MTLVNLSAALSPANSARLAAGTAQLGGVVVQDVATKQVLQWAPAAKQATTSLCARLGPYGLAVAAVVVVGSGLWMWRNSRKQQRKLAELSERNEALAREKGEVTRKNEILAEENARLERFAGKHALRGAVEGPPAVANDSSEASVPPADAPAMPTSPPCAQSATPVQAKRAA